MLTRRYPLYFRTLLTNALLLGALGAATGCFAEQSFPMKERQLEQIPAENVREDDDDRPLTTRHWVEAVQPRLEPELPALARKALTTEELTDEYGRPRNVYRTFGIDRGGLDSIIGNYWGLLRSAHVAPSDDSRAANEWKGYEPVEIPADDGLVLSGRMAAPTGEDLGGSYIVVTHGLFGRQAGTDQYNLAEALRKFGHHVICVDMRGHGETGRKHPQYPITFGLDESRDLLAVSRWVRAEHRARRVGLIGYSIGGHQALMAAWLDGDPGVAHTVDAQIARAVSRPDFRPQFDAGIFVVSPVLNMIEYADSLDRRRTIIDSPVRSIFQDKTQRRMKELTRKGSHRMWDLMEAELTRSRWMSRYPDYAALQAANLHFIDFCQLAGPRQGARRMEAVRVPVLVLQAADDPLAGSAQAVGDVFARVENPNCGVVLLKEGGHGGFPSLSTSYYYSLMKAFFDPATAPAAVDTYPDLVRRDHVPTEPLRLGQQ